MVERADKATIRKLIVDIKNEKVRWLNDSIKRMYDAGMTVFEICSILDVPASTVYVILHYHYLIEREDIR